MKKDMQKHGEEEVFKKKEKKEKSTKKKKKINRGDNMKSLER